MRKLPKLSMNPATWIAFLAGCLLVVLLWIFAAMIRKR